MAMNQLKTAAALLLGVALFTGAMGAVIRGQPGAAGQARSAPVPPAKPDERPEGPEKKGAAKPEAMPPGLALARVKKVDLTKPAVTVEMLHNDGKFHTHTYSVAKDAEIVLASGKKTTLNGLKRALPKNDGLGTAIGIDKNRPIIRVIRVFKDQKEYDRRIQRALNAADSEK
jgi:hypothetical protein